MAPQALLVLLAGCAGDDATDATGIGETGEAVPTFAEVRDGVLRPSCGQVGCHASTSSESGLALIEGQEYEALVGAPSPFADGEVYVVPGDADGSYVVKKITGAQGIVGEPMPPPFGMFDPRLLADLRAWIDAGALDN